MKYLYGDSTEFPLKIDFLRLLDKYVDTSVSTIKLENNVFENKEEIMDRRRLKNSVTNEMDAFHVAVKKAISEAVGKSKEPEKISEHAQKSKNFLENYTSEGKKTFSNEIFQEIAQFEKEIDETDEQNRKTMESFFILDPIPIINKEYTVKADKKKYLSKVQNECEGNITYIFNIVSSEIPFWSRLVKASDFLEGVKIPAKMKKHLLKKETEPELITLDDYTLTNLVFSGNELEVVFRKNLDFESERFRLKMNFMEEFNAEIYYAQRNGVEQNIKGDPELKAVLNILRLHELGDNIIKQLTDLYGKRDVLTSLTYGGKDVFEENLIFDLIQKVAVIFAPTITEIKQHAPSKTEISLKTEDETGKRNEIYLKISHIKEELNSIGQKGEKLYELLEIE